MTILSWTIPHLFAQLFSSDPTIIQLAVWGIHVYTFAMIPVSTQYTFVDGFTAVGRAPRPPSFCPCSEKQTTAC